MPCSPVSVKHYIEELITIYASSFSSYYYSIVALYHIKGVSIHVYSYIQLFFSVKSVSLQSVCAESSRHIRKYNYLLWMKRNKGKLVALLWSFSQCWWYSVCAYNLPCVWFQLCDFEEHIKGLFKPPRSTYYDIDDSFNIQAVIDLFIFRVGIVYIVQGVEPRVVRCCLIIMHREWLC